MQKNLKFNDMTKKDEYLQSRNQLLAKEIIAALQSRDFDAFYTSTAAEASALALSLIPEQASVSWGGSMSVEESGIIECLRNGGYTLIDRDKAKNSEERTAIMRQALLCDVFLTGFNAITETGVLVNIDKNGNRVAAIAFGPKSVIALVGMNKVCKTVEEAVQRARNHAAPLNAQRVMDVGICNASAGKSPCMITGQCKNCKGSNSICSQIVITRNCSPAGRIKIILVGESLGF